MSNDLISRKAAINRTIGLLYYHQQAYEGMEDDARRFFEGLPAVDAEPVRRGKWNKLQELDNVTCSACGWLQLLRTKYCPNCGAKMEAKNYTAEMLSARCNG